MTVISSIGVLGAGVIGSSIATRIAAQGFNVVLVDTKPEFLERSLSQIQEHLDSRESDSHHHYPEASEDILKRINATTDSSCFKDLPIIIECIPEDAEAKHDALRWLSDICNKEAIFATSISSCTVTSLTEELNFSDRVVGMHFFLPPWKNPLVEVVCPPKASKRAVRLALQVTRILSGVTIESQDVPGFAVKRQRAAYFSEAVRMLNEGANVPTIDAAAKAAFGVEQGPFEAMNNAGIAIAEFASMGLAGKLPDIYVAPERLRAQAASKEDWHLDGEVDATLCQNLSKQFKGLAILVGAAAFDEKVASPEDINWAARYGLGFTKGPFELFNELGADAAVALVESVATKRATAMPAGLASFNSKTGDWPLNNVELSIDNEIASITIKRPDTGNALDEQLAGQIETALKRAERSESVKAILISGTDNLLVSSPPRAFYVEHLEKGDVDSIVALHKRIHTLFTKIAEAKKPTIAMARGCTFGAGLELGLSCRYLVAGPRAFFSFPETGLGIHPAFGGTQRLPRKVGKAIGKYAIFAGDVFTADAAERLGIVDAILEDDEAISLLLGSLGGSESLSDDEAVPTDDELKAIALFNGTNCPETLRGKTAKRDAESKRVMKVLATKAPVAITLTNKLIDDGLGLDPQKALNFELSAFSLILGTKDALLGMKTEAGVPDFKGE